MSLFLLLCGCSSKTYLMPTPAIYTVPDWNPFKDVPSELQGDKVSVLYVTDRAAEEEVQGQLEYGYARSRSAAFGEAFAQMGQELSWEELVQASRQKKRKDKIELQLIGTRELARFAKTPPSLVLTDKQLKIYQPGPSYMFKSEAEQRFKKELALRLSQTPRKEVFIYIHGFNNTFEDAVLVTAEIWHFLGREGVPICYTWPTGVGGVKLECSPKSVPDKVRV